MFFIILVVIDSTRTGTPAIDQNVLTVFTAEIIVRIFRLATTPPNVNLLLLPRISTTYTTSADKRNNLNQP
jgi:hypothetical protein